MVVSSSYLIDTNILLRILKPNNPEFYLLRSLLNFFYRNGTQLFYASQNLIEFWNVLTRPINQNGYGLTAAEADKEAKRIEKTFLFLKDTEAIHDEWRKLVVTYSVSGAKVHDAHLVAVMKVYGVSHVLTLNVRDFTRYKEITAVHPTQITV